jgi:hypothetical protein
MHHGSGDREVNRRVVTLAPSSWGGLSELSTILWLTALSRASRDMIRGFCANGGAEADQICAPCLRVATRQAEGEEVSRSLGHRRSDAGTRQKLREQPDVSTMALPPIPAEHMRELRSWGNSPYSTLIRAMGGSPIPRYNFSMTARRWFSPV